MESECGYNVLDTIILHFGTNNIKTNPDINSMCEQYQNLIEAVRSMFPEANIVCSSIIQRTDRFRNRKLIDDFNDELKEMTSCYKNCSITTHEDVTDDCLVDGVHPNPRGLGKMCSNYKRVAENFGNKFRVTSPHIQLQHQLQHSHQFQDQVQQRMQQQLGQLEQRQQRQHLKLKQQQQPQRNQEHQQQQQQLDEHEQHLQLKRQK